VRACRGYFNFAAFSFHAAFIIYNANQIAIYDISLKFLGIRNWPFKGPKFYGLILSFEHTGIDQRKMPSVFLVFLWCFFNCDMAFKITIEFEIIIIDF
jgi:hypothetical protein